MSQQIEEKDLIKTLNPNDVLCGRGSGPNDYRGNIKFRNMVYERRAEYLASTTRKAKGQIAQEIIDKFRTNFRPPGRFLKKVDPKTAKALGITRGNEVWVEVDDETALEKAKQALRQNRDYANAGNKANGDNKKDSGTNNGKKKIETITGQKNVNGTLHTYPVTRNDVLSTQAPISLHAAEHMSNNFFPSSTGIQLYRPNHYPTHPQENDFRHLQYQRQDFYAAQHRQASSRFPRRNTIGAETVSWDNCNNGRQPYYQDHNRIDRQQFRPDGMISSMNIPQSRFHPMEMNEFAEQGAIGYTYNMGNSFNEFNDQRLVFDKGIGIVNKFADDESEMYFSDTESKHRGRGRRASSRSVKKEAGPRSVKKDDPHTVKDGPRPVEKNGSPSLEPKADSRSLKDESSSRALRQSDVSHPGETTSMEFRNSSESSGLGLTYEQYQILTRDEEGSPERLRSAGGSVSTMGTIDMPKKYVFQLPNTDLDSSILGADSKGRNSHSKKMSGRSVRSNMSGISTLKSSIFSEMSMSEASHDLGKHKLSSQNKQESIIDTTAIQNEEGKIKNLRYFRTTPRPLADMEDEPDELSSLGETSLTILHAAMDQSVFSTESNYTSGVDSISEYNE